MVMVRAGAAWAWWGVLRAAAARRLGGGAAAEVGRRALSTRTVAVGMSGGVDSAVAALLLKQQGHRVFGVFMRNWDERNEDAAACSTEQDYLSAKRASDALGIDLVQVDCEYGRPPSDPSAGRCWRLTACLRPCGAAPVVAQYWDLVFQRFLGDIKRGLTPNPDLACNRHIKFKLLLEHARRQGADCLATGHYARLRRAPGGGVALLRGLDRAKDQSYFLAQVPGEALRRCIFPVGERTKAEVRALAERAGLPNARRRSSAGICFIGRRKFGEFVSEYIEPTPGRFVCVEDGAHVADHAGVELFTVGQRARIPGAARPWYVAGKDLRAGVIYVAQGEHHPALYAEAAALHSPFWISGDPVAAEPAAPLRCEFKARYLQAPGACAVRRGAVGRSAFAPDGLPGPLAVELARPARALTPQQAFVLYDGDVCLGGALVGAPGKTLHEAGRPVPSALREAAA